MTNFRSDLFPVVLVASWAGTDGSTLEQRGAGPGLVLLVVQLVSMSVAGAGGVLRAAALMRPARSMTLGVDEESPSRRALSGCGDGWPAGIAPAGVPPARLLPARVTRAAPYIYSETEIAARLDASDQLRPPISAATYRTLIALMAATGIRTGEALGLDVTDFDQQAPTLTVTGKYGKTRLLPLHPSVRDGLTEYLQDCRRLLPVASCPALLITTRSSRDDATHAAASSIRVVSAQVPPPTCCDRGWSCRKAGGWTCATTLTWCAPPAPCV